jgi:hypothetical protein
VLRSRTRRPPKATSGVTGHLGPTQWSEKACKELISEVPPGHRFWCSGPDRTSTTSRVAGSRQRVARACLALSPGPCAAPCAGPCPPRVRPVRRRAEVAGEPPAKDGHLPRCPERTPRARGRMCGRAARRHGPPGPQPVAPLHDPNPLDADPSFAATR